MSATNGVVFFANKIYQNFTKSSAPTWEDEDGVLGGAAVDSLGDAVAAGGLAFDILDTQRLTRIAVDSDDTDGAGNDDSATWRFDLDLNSLQDIDFAIVDNHDVRKAYYEEIKANIDVYHDTNSTFNGSTVLVPSKHFSGLIGKTRPYLEFDGVDDYVSKSNDADLNFGANTDFSLEVIFKVSTHATEDRLLEKGSTGAGGKRYVITLRTATGYIVGGVDDNVNDPEVIGATDVTDGVWHHAIITFDHDGNMQIYLDGSTDGDAVSMAAVGNIDDAAKPLAIGISSHDLSASPLTGGIALVRIWNRVLSASEVATRYAGWTHTPIPAADQEASQTDITPTGQAWSDSNTEGNSIAGLTETLCTISSVTEAGETPDAVHAGTWMVKMALAAGNSYSGDSFTTVAGKKYRASGWCYVPTGTGGTTQLRVGTTQNDNDLGYSAYTTRDVWVYVEEEYTATATTTYISFFNSAASGDMYVDDVVNVQIGCVAEYHPDGINPDQSGWYDSSSNNLDAVISGAIEKDCPTSTNGKGDFTLYEFTEVRKRYWFWQINLDNNTADADTSVGQIGLGKKFEVDLAPDLPIDEGHLYDGISLIETQGGRRSSNKRYGRRLRWGLNWSYISTAEKTNFETFFETIDGKLYPFWFTLNYDDNEPIFYWARLVNNPKFTQQADGVYSVNLVIEEEIK